MAGIRPTFIAMPQGAFDSIDTPRESPTLPSPRAPHVAGAIAPAMSPLDVFAAQSRALAKQLEEQQRNGDRGSRLPPLVVKDGLAKKPQYFRAPSLERRSKSRERKAMGESSPTRKQFEIEEPSFRPKSHYPKLSNVDSISGIPSPDVLQGFHPRLGNYSQTNSPRIAYITPQPASDYFAEIPRAPSPEPMLDARSNIEALPRLHHSKAKKSFDSLSQQSHKSELDRGMSVASTSSYHSTLSHHALRPPNPPYARNTPSIRSVDSEEDNPGITPSSSWEHRKMSSSSGFSAPQSPVHSLHQARRSPSLASESSHQGHRPNKPSHNFSRPMSRDSRPSMDVQSRMSSADDQLGFIGEDGIPSFPGNGFIQFPDELGEGERPTTPGGTSYIYSKWSLPRGRLLRQSEQFNGPSLGMRSTESLDAITHSGSFLPTPPRSLDLDRHGRSSLDLIPRPPPIPTSSLQNRHSLTSMKTTNSESTIKGSQHTVRPSESMTAEDHLNKGIECHERGSLNESTYHLRLAARQNNPTAMLLYALACRHGWGMRPNPSEGVSWLRKAMDSANPELTQDDGHVENGLPRDFEAMKTRKAQFALSIYELGVSHMNGWGTVQDKALALKCFEQASSWGDADAMSEAGFCYAQGVGCKKDLKKAAKYYRSAEARGVSMVGNSWIYKSKYADADGKTSSKAKNKTEDKDTDDRAGRSNKQSTEKEKKPRDKSRTRSLFSRKKRTDSTLE